MIIWIILGSVVSACVSIGAAFYLMRRYSAEVQATIEPQFGEVRDLVSEVRDALERAQPQITRSQTIIAEHGTTPRQVKVAEKYLAEDFMDQYPEIKGVLGMVSPRTAEYLESNPDIFLTVLERWGPKLKMLMGEVGESGVSSRGRDWVHREQ